MLCVCCFLRKVFKFKMWTGLDVVSKVPLSSEFYVPHVFEVVDVASGRRRSEVPPLAEPRRCSHFSQSPEWYRETTLKHVQNELVAINRELEDDSWTCSACKTEQTPVGNVCEHLHRDWRKRKNSQRFAEERLRDLQSRNRHGYYGGFQQPVGAVLVEKKKKRRH